MYYSDRFNEELKKFDNAFQERVDKIEDKLVENPKYGTPLGVEWLERQGMLLSDL